MNGSRPASDETAMSGASDGAEEERLRELMRLLRKADETQAGEHFLGEFRIPAARVPLRHHEGMATLTKAEVAVLRFLGWGRANRDIATVLAISENTVRVHLNNMCNKLELDGVRELNALAGLLFYPTT
ncbi:MAG: helix-turn-helix transcriptional regulator [Novosphingobium sp.]|jgi:DNA-binding NarL/FixJ family response regulator